MPMIPLRFLILACFLTVVAGACDSGPTATPPEKTGPDPVVINMEVVSGDDQTGYVETSLDEPLVIRITDANSRGIAGRSVQWSITSGSGALSRKESVTDASGESSSEWTLGSEPGSYSVTATAEGMDPVTFSATAMADTVAPELIGFSFTPSGIDISQDSATIEFTTLATDLGSGIKIVSVHVKNSTGAFGRSCAEWDPVEGTPAEGTWKCAFIVPPGMPGGTWNVSEIMLQDEIDNERRYSVDELSAAGFATEFSVANDNPDSIKPVLAELSFSPDSVDVSDSDATLQFTARITDAGVGVREASIAIESTINDHWAQCSDMTLTEGNAADGFWSCEVTIPRSSKAGPWQVARVSAYDNASNLMYYQEDDVADAGFPIGISVTSTTEDTVPPTLIDLSVSPDTVDLSTGSKIVTFTILIEDSGSGNGHIIAFLLPPDSIDGGGGCLDDTPAEGSSTIGRFGCSRTISEFAMAGEWVIELWLEDKVGNFKTILADELESLGFDGTVTVIR